MFDTLSGFEGKTLVIGGDGRYYNKEVIVTAIQMAAANGFGRVLGRARRFAINASRLQCHPPIWRFWRLILSASHNPGGPDGDFGIKYNIGNGGPAPEKITDTIFANTQKISQYKIERGTVDLSKLGTSKLGNMTVQVIDPVDDYAALMQKLFDFDAISAMFKSGFRMKFDGMGAITGPYGTRVLEQMLGAGAGTVMNGIPLPDFGGHHPDPNLVHAKELGRSRHACWRT